MSCKAAAHLKDNIMPAFSHDNLTGTVSHVHEDITVKLVKGANYGVDSFISSNSPVHHYETFTLLERLKHS